MVIATKIHFTLLWFGLTGRKAYNNECPLCRSKCSLALFFGNLNKKYIDLIDFLYTKEKLHKTALSLFPPYFDAFE